MGRIMYSENNTSQSHTFYSILGGRGSYVQGRESNRDGRRKTTTPCCRKRSSIGTGQQSQSPGQQEPRSGPGRVKPGAEIVGVGSFQAWVCCSTEGVEVPLKPVDWLPGSRRGEQQSGSSSCGWTRRSCWRCYRSANSEQRVQPGKVRGKRRPGTGPWTAGRPWPSSGWPELGPWLGSPVSSRWGN